MSVIHTLGDLHPAEYDTLQPYTSVITDHIGRWRSFLSNDLKSQWFKQEEITAWLDRIESGIISLQFRFLFETVEQMHIDLLASGFPHRYSLRTFSDECKDSSKQDHRAKRLQLKRAFLEDLRKRHKANIALLHEISITHALETVESTGLPDMFRIVSLREIETEKENTGRRKFVCVWERYTNRNIPVLYSLFFETDKELDQTMIKHLALVLEEDTTDLVRLKLLAQRIDQGSATIYPKVLSRIILGPVFISGFTRDDNLLQKALDATHPIPFDGISSRIIYEYLVSENEIKVRSLTDPHGKRINTLQEFAVRELDEECRLREVTEVNKYLFAPHTLIQSLDETWRHEINHTFITEQEK